MFLFLFASVLSCSEAFSIMESVGTAPGLSKADRTELIMVIKSTTKVGCFETQDAND